jgi:hypothetical protein
MLVHLLENDDQYADRTWAELEAAAGFPDWNPSHFLDTAEMTHALAMGYDWLYHRWTEAQRNILQNAIVTLGLKPGMDVYRGNSPHNQWHKNVNNWNQVCNGGLSTGALAIADQEPDLARDILFEALKSIPLSMSHYAPDGAGTEGVTYWDYGARYNIIYLSALETALGTDFGLPDMPGFKESGHYQIYLSGADRWAFDFADCGLRRMSTPMHFWMGKKYSLPQYSWFRYSELAQPDQHGNVLDLLWFDDSGKDFDPNTLPLDKYFRVAESASIRSGWDPDALVLGIQAGDNNNLGGHRHLDLGTFILEALGERFVLDCGTERQAYLRHQNNCERWEFYRIRAEGHNTLVLNSAEGPDQNPGAIAPITHFKSTPNHTTASIDLSEAYVDHAKRVQRTFECVDRSSITLTDELEAENPIEIFWFLHTPAQIEISDDRLEAALTLNGKQLLVKIESGPSIGEFDVIDAAPLSTSPNPDVQTLDQKIHKLVIHLPDLSAFTLTVRFTPQNDA